MTEKHARLTLVHFLPERAKDKHLVGLWRCDCGNETSVALTRVRNGYTQSCGCLVAETSQETNRKHGRRYTPEYSSWQSMKWRCLDPNNKDFPRWGGAGVTIWPEWVDSFERFFADVGPRPKGTTLDRIDGTRGYEPGNVRWATPTEQARNRRNGYIWHIKGREFASAEEAAAVFGVSDVTVHRWVKGFHDKRRNTRRPAREDCHVVPRY
jgi:hypothetical protein